MKFRGHPLAAFFILNIWSGHIFGTEFGPKLWEDQKIQMKNAARGCPRKFIWRPMCENMIFQIWFNFGPRAGTRAGLVFFSEVEGYDPPD